jgi:hypothetical protein
MKTPSILQFEHTLDVVSAVVKLSTLLQQQMRGAYAELQLQLTLHVPAAAKLQIVDDLLSYDIAQSSITLVLEQDAQVEYRCIMIKDKDQDPAFFVPDVDKKVTVVCAGQGAHADVVITCFGDAQRRFKIKTIQDHQTASTTSMVLIKGVFDDESQLRCDTLIRVEPQAHQVQATQKNKNLLLSPHARAIAIPKLEVLANDVQCSHGAAMSQIDEEQLFYLQSRGITPAEGRQLLIDAFLQA